MPSQTEFLPEVNELIDRLVKVDFTKYVYDKKVIKECFDLHLKELGLPEMPIRFFDDFKSGYKVAWSAAESAARSAAESAARSAAWSSAESAAWSSAESAAWSSARSAAWSAALRQYCKTDSDFKYFHIWLPFVKAFEAGVYVYWIAEKEIICICRPVLTLKGERLHNENGPAVEWSNKEKYYFLNGVQVSENIVTTKAEELDPLLLIKEQNAEVRREIIRKVGVSRLLQKLNAQKLDSWREYELYNIDNIDIEPVHILKMTCPSTKIFYSLRIPPEIKKAYEAITWINNGIKPEEFLIEA